MRKSLRICKNRYYPNKDYWDFYRDYTEYYWDMRANYYGEPLELPKTLKQIIMEGLNEKGSIYGV